MGAGELVVQLVGALTEVLMLDVGSCGVQVRSWAGAGAGSCACAHNCASGTGHPPLLLVAHPRLPHLVLRRVCQLSPWSQSSASEDLPKSHLG